ncbi:hotdog fold domain-containing protein [Patulibacter defluvii]|uniref:hotdog fold domain-containing protein n=1 Tax=Patulibacter defluvii TaxID=3095358 RepID=UPI002A74C17F|nr:hotdog fold domain-containing protein [Patulibacter sp. DM4]
MPSLNLLAAHRKLERVPLGRGVVSRAYRTAAPYFLTIPAQLDALAPGRAVASMAAVPWTRNHLGGVHAIAQCNLAEYAMGAVAEATVPASHRWIPRGMTVDYRARAGGRLTATATLELPAELAEKQELPVRIAIADREGVEVTSIEIRIWITARRS